MCLFDLDSLQTLLSPDGVDKYKDFGRKKRWNGSGSGYGNGNGGPGGGGGGGGGGGPPGPRITSMDNYRGTSSCKDLSIAPIADQYRSFVTMCTGQLCLARLNHTSKPLSQCALLPAS